MIKSTLMALCLLLVLRVLVILSHICMSQDIDYYYYVTPSESNHSDSCPGEPCHSLDYYATFNFEVDHPTTDSCISLYFMGGIHSLSRVMNLSNLDCFKLTANSMQEVGSSDKAIIHFNCKVEYILSADDECYWCGC